MQLRITDYHGVRRWRRELQDDTDNFLDDHEVNLGTDAQEYPGYDDPPEYLRTYRAAHGGRRDPGRAPRAPADVGALRRATGAGTSRDVASQGRHVIRGGYNHGVEVRT